MKNTMQLKYVYKKCKWKIYFGTVSHVEFYFERRISDCSNNGT